jgi:hypothetical protein
MTSTRGSAGLTGRQRRAVGLVLLLVVGAVGAVAVLLLRDHAASPSTAIPASSGPTSAATPVASTAAPVLSPLTGRPVSAGRPVLAVKIDNVPPARPQTGLDKADVVYVEPVEGGLSRILAIFSSSLPSRIGPVRSARESDLELLGQYGRVGLVYSGANRSVHSAIADAPVVDLSQDRVPSAYSRSSAHKAPHNLYVDPGVLLRLGKGSTAGKGIAVAKDIGFRFGDLPVGEGTTTGRQVVRYGAASTAFTWSPTRKRWNVTLDGRAASSTDGGRLAATTVVVQYVDVTSSELHDTLGNVTPYTHSVGSGKALVLRDGVSIKARWSRPSADSGTTFTTAAGADLPFAAGQVWVVFAPDS